MQHEIRVYFIKIKLIISAFMRHPFFSDVRQSAAGSAEVSINIGCARYRSPIKRNPIHGLYAVEKIRATNLYAACTFNLAFLNNEYQ